MKIKISCILLLGMLMLGCNNTNVEIPTVKSLNIPQEQITIVQSNLKIINAISEVKRGGTGVIIIQGMPKTLYNIKTSYKLGNKIVPVIQWRTTDATGVATFNWIVSKNTIVGTYPATISGGGDVVNTNHTVLP